MTVFYKDQDNQLLLKFQVDDYDFVSVITECKLTWINNVAYTYDAMYLSSSGDGANVIQNLFIYFIKDNSDSAAAPSAD